MAFSGDMRVGFLSRPGARSDDPKFKPVSGAVLKGRAPGRSMRLSTPLVVDSMLGALRGKELGCVVMDEAQRNYQ